MLSNHPLHREVEVALAAAREAVDAIMAIHDAVGEHRTELGVVEKANNLWPVTAADRAANAIIVRHVRAAFPEDGVLAEESADDGGRLVASRFWCIDPVDGTKEFIARNGEFSVMIGLVDRSTGRPLLGVVVEPVNDLVMVAVLGGGAWRVHRDGREEALRVSDRSEASRVRIIVSRSHPDPQTQTVVKLMEPESLTPCGSVGVKIGRIVQDRADVYLNFSGYTRFWDTCAPDIILHEAGGRLTTLEGAVLDYSAASTVNEVPYVASNGACHALLVEHSREAQARYEARR